MRVIQINLFDRPKIKEFLQLSFKHYANIPQWVPPQATESRQVLRPRRHPFYRHSKAAFFIVRGRDGEVAGRIAVLNHRRYNRFNQKRIAFFTLFESVADNRVAGMLFQAAIHWAAEQGLDRIEGPKGFSVMDGMGLLVEGFEHADLVQIGVDNIRMMRELAGLGIQFYKKHRLYSRELN